MWLLGPFVLFPLIEIALFVIVGGWISLWPTLGLVVLSAIAGVSVLRRQGAQTAARVQKAAGRGGSAGETLAQGSLIMLAGLLLLIPGFFSDLIALALLIPPIRRGIIGRLGARATTFGMNMGGFGVRRGGMPHDTIDGEWEEVDPAEQSRRGPSGWTRPPLPGDVVGRPPS